MGYTINLNDTDPVAPAGKVNVKWQKGVVPADPAQPVPVSAYVDMGGGGGIAYAVDSGSVNVYAGTFIPTPTVIAGTTLAMKASNTNTGASTLNVDGAGNVAIKKNGTAALTAGDIVAGEIYYFTYDGTNYQLVAVPASGLGFPTGIAVHQTSHGFTTGNAVYFSGSSWAKAKSDAAGTLGIGIAVAVGSDDFNLFLVGFISGLSGLTAGQYYFVSDSSAGATTTTEPTTANHYSNPILFALSTTTGIVLPFRPSVVEPAAVNTIQKKTGNYTAVAGDIVLCDTSLGGFTVTLPASSANTGLPVTVKKVSADSNVLLIASTGGDTLDGNASPLSVIIPKESLTFIADGATDWPVT